MKKKKNHIYTYSVWNEYYFGKQVFILQICRKKICQITLNLKKNKNQITLNLLLGTNRSIILKEQCYRAHVILVTPINSGKLTLLLTCGIKL